MSRASALHFGAMSLSRQPFGMTDYETGQRENGSVMQRRFVDVLVDNGRRSRSRRKAME